MRSRDGNATPKELAYMEVTEALRQAHRGYGVMDLSRETAAFQRKFRDQVAKLHNRLLEESTLMGESIELEEKKEAA